MAAALWALPLACLMLLLLRRAPGAGAQGRNFELQQPQDRVSVMAGETLTLTCTVSKTGPIGPVRWLKGWGSTNQTVYDQRGSPPRVMRAQNESNTDYSILIRDVCPEDAGTYYCVKFQKWGNGDKLFDHGKGTEVSVLARPPEPAVSGPSRRAVPGQSVPFTCTAGGFISSDIRVKWPGAEGAVFPVPHAHSRTHTGAGLLASPGLWIGLLLDKALLFLVLFFLFKYSLP